MPRTFLILSSLALSALMLMPPSVEAQEKKRRGKASDQPILSLEADFYPQIQIDGQLHEWQGKKELSFQTLLSGEYDYDWTGPKDLSASVRAIYGLEKAYFMVQVKDNAVVAKRGAWKSDRVELWLQAENAQGKPSGSLKGLEIDLGPAVSSGKAALRPLNAKAKDGDVQLASFVSQEGYDFELSVDYAWLSKTLSTDDVALRFCVLVRDWDQDDPNEEEASIGSCPISPKNSKGLPFAKMGRIPLALHQKLWGELERVEAGLATASEQIRRRHKLSASSSADFVAYFNNILMLAGFGLGSEGLALTKIELAAPSIEGKSELSFKDIHGDKRDEIILTRHEICADDGTQAVKRQYFFGLDSEANLRLIGNVVVEQYLIDRPSESIVNQIKFNKTGLEQSIQGKPSTELRACMPAASEGMLPLLTTADGLKSRKFAFK